MSSLPALLLALLHRPESKRAIRIVVLVAIAIFVGRSLAQSWTAIAHHQWQISWPLLLAAFALLCGQELTYGFIWQLILKRLGYTVPWRVCLKIYLAAEFVRYIPGNVWHVLTRVTWAEREGVPKSFGLASMTVELATKIAAAALTFAVSLLWWSGLAALTGGAGHFATVALAVVAVPLLVIGLQPRLLELALNSGLRLLKREPIHLGLAYRDILLVSLGWVGSWIIGGLGFWLAIHAVLPLAFTAVQAPICIGIYALGWDIGFLSFITPSGLGFREGAVALLLHLAGIVPDLALATVLALLAARLLPTLAELVSVGWAYAVTQRTEFPMTPSKLTPTT